MPFYSAFPHYRKGGGQGSGIKHAILRFGSTKLLWIEKRSGGDARIVRGHGGAAPTPLVPVPIPLPTSAAAFPPLVAPPAAVAAAPAPVPVVTPPVPASYAPSPPGFKLPPQRPFRPATPPPPPPPPPAPLDDAAAEDPFGDLVRGVLDLVIGEDRSPASDETPFLTPTKNLTPETSPSTPKDFASAAWPWARATTSPIPEPAKGPCLRPASTPWDHAIPFDLSECLSPREEPCS